MRNYSTIGFINTMQNEKTLEALLESWTNQEKAQAIQLLKKSMSENSKQKRVPVQNVKDYVKSMLVQGLNDGSLKDYPEDYNSISRSQFYKEAIREVVKEVQEEYEVDTSSHPVLAAAWKDCEKARTLIELRKAFRLYALVLKSKFYTEDDIIEYARMIDEQDREIRQLREYKRIQEELFGIMMDHQEEYNIVIQAREMKKMGLTDTEICKVLKINRNRLNYVRGKVVLESVDGFVEK